MTSRMLLALLALLASLTGQIAPAQARAGGADAVGVSLAAVGPQRLARQARPAFAVRADRPRIQRDCAVVMLTTYRDCTPPVMLRPVLPGIDRARE